VSGGSEEAGERANLKLPPFTATIQSAGSNSRAFQANLKSPKNSAEMFRMNTTRSAETELSNPNPTSALVGFLINVFYLKIPGLLKVIENGCSTFSSH
jgi:hypothetical protein